MVVEDDQVYIYIYFWEDWAEMAGDVSSGAKSPKVCGAFFFL